MAMPRGSESGSVIPRDDVGDEGAVVGCEGLVLDEWIESGIAGVVEDGGIVDRRVATGIDAVAGSILPVTLPGDNEVTVSIHSNGRDPLSISGPGIDLELGPLSNSERIESLGINSKVRSVL